jgi:enamine deaminase RidA (YjgF/YER057c/UK114 family)
MASDSPKGTPRRRLISTGSPLEQAAGYSRAVVSGDFCFVSGTTGYIYDTMTMPLDVEDQARNALATIASVLAEAGFAMEDVVRVQYTVTDAALVERVFAVVGEAFGAIRPAATMVIAGLVRPEMLVEIEVTAHRP